MFSYVLPWTSRRVERRKVYLHRQDLKDGKELLVEGEMAPLPCSFLFLALLKPKNPQFGPVRQSPLLPINETLALGILQTFF